MSGLDIYHGSSRVIQRPVFGAGKAYNDYGKGFYCTEHLDLAKEWGCSEGSDGFANHYILETEGLKILDLSSEEYTILNWLAILMENRIGRLSTPIEKRGRAYLLENFLPDYKSYDVIRGYRADDSYFSFARAFVQNTISLAQLGYAMKLGKLGEQIVLISEKAFNSLCFVAYTVADHTIYYTKKRNRDQEARRAYMMQLEKEEPEGIFIRDIMREAMKTDDQRLR